MRKGQQKLIEKARKNGYSDGCIEILSREDLTVRELNDTYNRLWQFKNKGKEWAELFISISDRTMRNIISAYADRNADISLELLEKLSTEQGMCEYFSKGRIICRSLSDVEIVLQIGYTDIAFEILKIAQKCGEYEYSFRLLSVVDKIQYIAEQIKDYAEFFSSIDTDKMMSQNENCILDNALEWVKGRLPFNLKNADNIPQNIRNMDFQGYQGHLYVSGFHRSVNISLTAMSIVYCPFYKVRFGENGNIETIKNWKKVKKIVFFFNSGEFIAAYKAKGSWKYKPAQIRELFDAISICETKSDEENAQSVVTYLCEKYNTFIFKDLYDDYLQSGGLLLPILITQAACYHTKAEMFREFYHMPLQGSWNKKNANLSYLILKLHKRMTHEALARAMQCSDVLSLRKVGKKRYVMTQILYEAVYGSVYRNMNEESLVSDALKEEYENKKIKLNPINQTVNEHNARHRIQKIQIAKLNINIKEETKFMSLIENMPSDFELINTGKRLIEEGNVQRNCVAAYAKRINNDVCMIYSTVYENERHTIEIRKKKGSYFVQQCLRACNRKPNPELVNILNDNVRSIRG